MMARNRNELWARALMEEVVRSGVKWVVVAPGSRSTPLVLEAASRRELSMVVQVDERSAAFFALGVGKATGHPAAVITTSGTAVANLLPAVVEACQAEVPLLLFTADRPPHLRGADANQAIDQNHLFGRYVREFHELAPARISDPTLRNLRQVVSRSVAAAVGDPAGPVHLNLPFTKPLEPVQVAGDIPPGLEEEAPLATQGRVKGARPFTAIHPRRLAPGDPAVEQLRVALAGSRRPLLVAGPVPRQWETGPTIQAFSRDWGIPLLADPLSGARYGSSGWKAGESLVLGGYDLFLRDPVFRTRRRPDFILRLGATPTSVSLSTFLEEAVGVPQVVVDGGGRWKDHLAVATEYFPAHPGALLEALGSPPEGWKVADDWREAWLAAETAVARTVAAVEAENRHEVRHEGAVLAAVARATPPEELLFVSNSMPVRDLDGLVLPRREGLMVLGNRGASGIDGILSTALGAGAGAARRVTVVVGDLALIHDMNGLLALPGLPSDSPARRVILVVVNNQGGGIFQMLPVREYEPAFTRYFATPQAVEPARIAALHGLEYMCVGAEPDGHGNLETVLQAARLHEGPVLVEVRTHREENRVAHGEMVRTVIQALALPDHPQT
ncbi:MAG: 2-succinyl-5-enolpyruvyl-6-hydroxy-3-cyclohexene-1-carboxylic-acid synthase [Gemmatimonadota bacterium]